jgi:hypothetical protein
MRSIEDTIEEWLAEFGVLGRGKNGPYRYISYSQKKDLLMVLVRTLIEEGHDRETLESVRTANLIINACEAPDGASSRAPSKIKKSKQITASDLKFVLREFFRGSFVTTPIANQNTVVPSQKIETLTPKNTKSILDGKTPEEINEMIFNPKDRLVSPKEIDRSGSLNFDLFEELGLDPKDQ